MTPTLLQLSLAFRLSALCLAVFGFILGKDAYATCEWTMLSPEQRLEMISKVLEPTPIARNKSKAADPFEASNGVDSRTYRLREVTSPPREDGVYPYIIFSFEGEIYHTFLNRNQFAGDIHDGYLGTHRHLEARLPTGAVVLSAGEHTITNGMLRISNRSGTFPDNGGNNVFWAMNQLRMSGWNYDLSSENVIRVFDQNYRGDAHTSAAASVVMEIFLGTRMRELLNMHEEIRENVTIQEFFALSDKIHAVFSELSSAPGGLASVGLTVMDSEAMRESLRQTIQNPDAASSSHADLSWLVSTLSTLSVENSVGAGLFPLLIGPSRPPTIFSTVSEWIEFVSQPGEKDEHGYPTVIANARETLELLRRISQLNPNTQ